METFRGSDPLGTWVWANRRIGEGKLECYLVPRAPLNFERRADLKGTEDSVETFVVRSAFGQQLEVGPRGIAGKIAGKIVGRQPLVAEPKDFVVQCTGPVVELSKWTWESGLLALYS